MQDGLSQNDTRSSETSKDEQGLLRIAEAIADGSPVNWKQELQETPLASGPWTELRTIESIAAFHSPELLDGSPVPSVAGVEADADADELPATWGSLIVREQLGKGAFASVFRAYDPALEREVALKLPLSQDPSFAQTFLKEARRLALIQHDGVVRVYGADEAHGRVGMWMDLVEGVTLEENLSIRGPFSAAEAALVGVDLCRALAAVHGAGLVHRDLKAANVMREEGGRIVLMDFSSVVEARGELSDISDSSTQGTPYYMAPELLEGEPASSASDIYALGVLLYRLASGRYPVEADNFTELRQKLGREGTTSLLDVRPDLPVGFIQVIDQALATEPAKRFSSAGEMERALSVATNASRLPDPVEESTKLRSGRLLAGLIAAAVIVVALVMIFVVRQPVPLSVDAALYRKGELVDERLDSGDQLALGDRLFLEVAGTEPIHAYVLNEDAVGRRFRLFPLEGLVLENPLPAGVPHRLPGSILVGEATEEGDGRRYWEVTSDGGEETLMLIASTRSLADLEERIAAISPAGQISESEEGRFRGIGGLAAGRGERPQPSLEELRTELEESYGGEIRIWQIRLTNPPSQNDN